MRVVLINAAVLATATLLGVHAGDRLVSARGPRGDRARARADRDRDRERIPAPNQLPAARATRRVRCARSTCCSRAAPGDQRRRRGPAGDRTSTQMLEGLERERRESNRRAITDARRRKRRRIGQELHDEIGQRLTGVLLQLRAHDRARARRSARGAARRPRSSCARRSTRSARIAWQLRPGHPRRPRSRQGARGAGGRPRASAPTPSSSCESTGPIPPLGPEARARGLPDRAGVADERPPPCPRAPDSRRARPAATTACACGSPTTGADWPRAHVEGAGHPRHARARAPDRSRPADRVEPAKASRSRSTCPPERED